MIQRKRKEFYFIRGSASLSQDGHLARFGGQPLITLLGDRHANSLALGEGDPRLGPFADGEDVIQPDGAKTK